jgi:hypothetical protein
MIGFRNYRDHTQLLQIMQIMPILIIAHIMNNLVWGLRSLLDVLVAALERNQRNDETQNDLIQLIPIMKITMDQNN